MFVTAVGAAAIVRGVSGAAWAAWQTHATTPLAVSIEQVQPAAPAEAPLTPMEPLTKPHHVLFPHPFALEAGTVQCSPRLTFTASRDDSENPILLEHPVQHSKYLTTSLVIRNLDDGRWSTLSPASTVAEEDDFSVVGGIRVKF